MKDQRVYLAQILERIERVESFTTDGKDKFLGSELTQDAVIRNFEVMGEASKRISQDFRDKYPDIPWRSMAAFRDILIHAYDRVDAREVWRIIEKELPAVKLAIKKIIPSLDQLEAEIADEQ